MADLNDTGFRDEGPSPPPTEIPKRPIMPPEIAKAVVSVMAEIKPLAKDGKNKFQNYSYTSVDDFFEAVGPLMSKNSIFTMVFESELEVLQKQSTDDRGNTKVSMWLFGNYDIYLYHASGSFYGPVKRSTQVIASGPQSYASAMSFVEKYFLRSLFKIPTGELDEGDSTKESGLPPSPAQPPAPPKPPEPTIDLVQAKQLRELVVGVGGSLKIFGEYFKIGRLSELPLSKYEEAVAWIKESEPEPPAAPSEPATPPAPVNAGLDEPPAPPA